MITCNDNHISLPSDILRMFEGLNSFTRELVELKMKRLADSQCVNEVTLDMFNEAVSWAHATLQEDDAIFSGATITPTCVVSDRYIPLRGYLDELVSRIQGEH
jgi:hypothetical protein